MLSLRSRLAAASGLSAAGVLGVLVSHRVAGSVAEAMIAVVVVVAAAPAMALNVGESVAERGRDALARQARFAPTLVIAVLAMAVRAHSTSMAGIASSHVLGGIPLLHGSVSEIVGTWLCLLALSLAIAGSISDRLGSEAGIADLLMIVAVLTELGFAAALFAGGNWHKVRDLVSWVAVGIPVGAWAWFGRKRARDGVAPFGALVPALVGLLLVIIGARS